MLEIILLFVLGKKIAALAGEKGRSGWPFVLVLIALWVGGEIAGGVAGAVVSVYALGDDEPNMLLMIVGALVGAATGAVVAFLIVKSVPPVSLPDYEDEYDRPTRRRDRDDDDRDDDRDYGRDRDRR